MIITPHAIFIHFHKSGGQFINRLLLQYVPGATRLGYHLPLSEAPGYTVSLPAFGFVRNPWDWYVSWYAFNALTPLRNPLFRITSNDGTLDFCSTIENLVRLGQPDRGSMRESLAKLLPDSRENNMGSGLTNSLIANMHEPERGYLTWLWRYMFFDGPPQRQLHFGRLEQLRTDLPALLHRFAINVSPEMSNAILAHPPVNTSPHDHYRGYYTTALQNLIAAREGEYIETFGYSF